MYRELTVNSDTDLVKLVWETFPDWSESEIEELVDGGWVKVGDEIAHWGWQIYRGESVIIDKPVGDPPNKSNNEVNVRSWIENSLPSIGTGAELDVEPKIAKDRTRPKLEMTKTNESIQPDMTTNLDNQHVPRLLAAFRERLIDLTRRNRLINYRHSESSNTHVRIVDCGLNDLISEIIQGTQLEFAALPEATAVLDDEGGSEFRAAFESAALSDPEYLDRVQRQNMDGSNDPEFQAEIERSLKDRVRTQLRLPPRQGLEFASPTAIARAAGIDPSYHLELDTHRVSEDRLRRIQTLFLPHRMEAKLGKISDSAQRSIEESGVNRLYLAVGFLEWHEAEQSDRSCYAPLLVIPVTIERQSTSNRWRYFMRGTGEPLTDNVALRLRLRDEGLDLPEFGEGGNLGNYLEQVGNAIQEKNGWTVHLFATVGLFAFANIEIWNDLDPNNWPNGSLSEHPNILSLFGGGEPSPEIFAEEYQIDSPEVSAELPPLILNADSSQLSTIIDALGKRNLAVKGPPGTGKSQTIANLIAAALFRGEKVLFLAEKMAALEVVINVNYYCRSHCLIENVTVVGLLPHE